MTWIIGVVRLLSPGAWAAIAFAAVVAFAGVQTLRLAHAKADQVDAAACASSKAAGKACTPPKWQAEVLDLRPKLAMAEADLGRCQVNEGTLKAAIDGQNAVVLRWKASADKAQADAAAALAAAQAAGRASEQLQARLMAVKPGPDACASLDALILESVK